MGNAQARAGRPAECEANERGDDWSSDSESGKRKANEPLIEGGGRNKRMRYEDPFEPAPASKAARVGRAVGIAVLR